MYDVIHYPLVNDDGYSPALYNYWALNINKSCLRDEEQALNKTTGASAIFGHAPYGRGAAISVNAYERMVNVRDAKLKYSKNCRTTELSPSPGRPRKDMHLPSHQVSLRQGYQGLGSRTQALCCADWEQHPCPRYWAGP